ncbi:hypothetical protein AX17_005731 [Amanita inopinata Kibby_2008]|nr:hypothetical protein AX17_005731 [Amanita inopinata Kibby_2008]
MMNVLKNQTFFRPTSRPTSPNPASIPPPSSDSHVVFERPSRPLNMLSLGNFRRPSPAPRLPSSSTPTTLVQDGSYLEMLSLKLSEAVSKALAQPAGPGAPNEQLAGRRPIPTGRGHALGALIASELKASRDNPHLYRAIVRSLQRPLSVLLTNLSAYLLPLLASSPFCTPAVPTVQMPTPNPTQLHALSIATFAAELLETFDDLGLGLEGDVRGDGLKAIREGLGSLVTRVINPLINGLKAELMQLMEALEHPAPNLAMKSAMNNKPAMAYHSSIVTLQTVMPLYARALTRYTSFAAAQSTLATFLISIVWKALVGLSHRPRSSQSTPPSPFLLPVAVKKGRSSPTSTPPVTPPAGRFAIKLPPSRPPSPHVQPVAASIAADSHALYELLCQLPRPTGQSEATLLAREAVDEAFDGLEALAALPELADTSCHDSDPATSLDNLTADLPLLIALPVVLQTWGGLRNATVASMIGLSEEEYRRACLTGFSRAEECETVIAQRVLDALREEADANPAVVAWIEREVAAE